MKRKSREVNVFSMSALDLFASALGAFILLAVIFMPFFPNTGDHPKISEALRQRIETLAKQLSEATSDVASLTAQNESLESELNSLRNAPKVQFPHLDLVVVLDTTGSMSDEIESLQKEIAQFTELMTKMTPSFSMGVVEFKDRCDPTEEIREFSLALMDTSSLVLSLIHI